MVSLLVDMLESFQETRVELGGSDPKFNSGEIASISIAEEVSLMSLVSSANSSNSESSLLYFVGLFLAEREVIAQIIYLNNTF